MIQEMLAMSVGGGESSGILVQEGEITLPASGTVTEPLNFDPDYLRVYPTFPLTKTYAIESIYTKLPDGFGGTRKSAQYKTYTNGSDTYTTDASNLPLNAWGRLKDVTSDSFTHNYYDTSEQKLKYIALKWT